MASSWFRSRRSALISVASSLAIVAVVVTTAVLSTGYRSQQLTLNDGAVWVANNSSHAIGRANTAIAQLNSVVKANGSDLETVQQGDTVLLVDRSNAQLSIVNPATSEAASAVALPAERPEVWIAGQNAVIMAQTTGQVWITPLSQLQNFNQATKETFNFGKNAAATVDENGVLYVASPGSGQVFEVDAAASSTDEQQWPIRVSSSAAQLQITAVNGQWAVLDTLDGTLVTESRRIDVSQTVPSGASPELQLPSVSQSSDSSAVLVATTRGLVSVPFSSGSATTLSEASSGVPARPLALNGCVFSAWAGGALWRQCGSAAAERFTLDQNTAAATLSFAVNGTTAALNDATSGDAWAVQRQGELISNWSDLIKTDQTQVQQNQQTNQTQKQQSEVPPVAVDEEFGARPGKSTLLPVLMNDYDANGDVLVVASVGSPSADSATLSIVNSDQEVMITLPETAPVHSVVSFKYTITDGHGESATANVNVTVRAPTENSAPRQVHVTTGVVGANGQVTANVLGDWYDPDGDAFYLSSATVANPKDRVSWKADGEVLFTDGGASTGVKTITLGISDGSAIGTGSLQITVYPQGQVPVITQGYAVQGYVGQSLTVSPLDHAMGGNSTLRLNAVPAVTGLTIVPSFSAGTFTVVAAQAGSYEITYDVTDGSTSTSGLVRLDVSPPPSSNSAPITVPKTVFVSFGNSQTVDVAGSDIDPAGGVLLVSELDSSNESIGVRAVLLEQSNVQITLTKNITRSVNVGYTVTNGLSQTAGTITVIEIPTPSQLQPPIARDDTVNVPVGNVIDIPVLTNDEQPDGQPLTLEPNLVQNVGAGGGLLFASGNELRYLAPSSPGNYTAIYAVSSAGQTATATVHINVREPNVATDSAPIPATVTGRVLAGGTVRVTIPLTGISPAGNTVQLIGQSSNPSKGTVTGVGEDYFDYAAGSYSAGTDSFTYTVMDSLGLRATGTVRIGIAPRLDAGRNPVANPDSVQVRPGKTVIVPVLENDSDPDGGTLTITKVEPTVAGATATILNGEYIQVAPPDDDGKTWSFIYTIQNVYGGTAQAFLTVAVSKDAPLSRPVASDTVLTVTDVLGKTSLDVPVLSSVFFADGPVSSLGVALLSGYGSGATVLPNKEIRVTIKAQSQVIPFQVTHPDDPSIKAYAFIRVPGYDDALPQINTKAPAITVRSEQSVTIDLDQYVAVLGNRTVRLVDTASVEATHANGDNLVVNSHTLVFTSAEQYYGPASISFEVADGDPADSSTHVAELVLPITVTPRNNQPPIFVGGTVELEPGQQNEYDLVQLTNYPATKDDGELVYSVVGEVPTGFQVTINGQRLDITVSASTQKGTQATLVLGVRDAVNSGQSGRLQIDVVPSTRPLAIAQPDSAVTPRGQTTTINVLANDQSTNPFPGSPLQVINIAGISGASLPAGVSAIPSADKSTVAVSVAQSASPGIVTFQYEIADASNDPSRYVWGNVQVYIEDRPDPVSNLRVTEFDDHGLKLSFSPGSSNNSAITGYEADVTGPGGFSQVVQCGGAGNCSVPTPGNGPSNQVTISIVAINSIGRSDPTSITGWSDVIPPPPVNLNATPLDRGLTITWNAPNVASGSPVTYYVVQVGAQSIQVPATATGEASGYSLAVQGVGPNGTAVTFSVSARNSSPNSLVGLWNQATGTGVPAGAPLQSGTPSATASGANSGQATVNWAGDFDNNGAAISSYWAMAYTGTAPTCSGATGPTGNTQSYSGSTTSAILSGLSYNVTYSVMVFAYNGQGCTASPVATVITRGSPGDVTALSGSIVANGSNTGKWDYQVTGLTFDNAAGTTSFEYQYVTTGIDGSTYGPVALGSLLTTSGLTQYNVANTKVQIKACETYSDVSGALCSADWETFSIPSPYYISLQGLAAHVTKAASTTTLAQGNWTETGAWVPSSPASLASATWQYSCQGGVSGTWRQFTPNAAATSETCTATSSNPNVFPDLDIQVSVDGGKTFPYTRSYAWNAYVTSN